MRWIFLFAFAFLGQLSAEIPKYAPKDFSHLIGMPGFSDQLLQMHFKLYQGYVANANELLSKLKSMSEQGQANSFEYGSLKRRLGWEFDGMRLHELYFGNLGGNGVPNTKSSLYQAISDQYGDFESWKNDFIATGRIRGIGWAALYLDPEDGRLVNVWVNEHDAGHLATGKVILMMDVFEHAFMPQFGLDRLKYIEVFFNNVNWEVAEERYTAGTK